MALPRTFEELILPSTNPVRTNEPQRTYEEIGVTIDKRRDHKRLAEERRRRRRWASAPQKKPGRGGRASLRARPRPGFFWGAEARRRRGLRSDPDPGGVIINKRRDHKQKA